MRKWNYPGRPYQRVEAKVAGELAGEVLRVPAFRETLLRSEAPFSLNNIAATPRSADCENTEVVT